MATLKQAAIFVTQIWVFINGCRKLRGRKFPNFFPVINVGKILPAYGGEEIEELLFKNSA